MKDRCGVVVLVAAALCSASVSMADEVTYRKDIKPVFDSKCVVCHGAGAPEYYAFKEEKEKWVAQGKGMRMDTYSHLLFFTAWPDTGSLMRRLDDGKNVKDGKSGNMYEHLGQTEEDRQKNLQLFKAWIGNWTLKRWAEVSKEDMDGIKAKY